MKTLSPLWSEAQTQMVAHPAYASIYSYFALAQLSQLPDVDWLNTFYSTTWTSLRFIEQSEFAEEAGYYEQVIAQQRRIPVRADNYHDVFNALVWRLFPKTKWRISCLHDADIQRHGLSPRTLRRNQLTHWDECGLILAIEQRHLLEVQEVIENLSYHRWSCALWQARSQWHQQVYPVIFGHAIFEALLAPFDELTAKWLPVLVVDGFATLPLAEQYACLDDALMQCITQLDDFTVPRILRPLPICGIPGWWQGQDATFYANTRVFRPARRGYASITSMDKTIVL